VGAVRGNRAGWGSLEVVITLTAGFLLALAFVGWERRESVPMLPLRFFRSRAFSGGNAAGFLFFASLYGSAFFLAQLLSDAGRYTAITRSATAVPTSLVEYVFSPGAAISPVI